MIDGPPGLQVSLNFDRSGAAGFEIAVIVADPTFGCCSPGLLKETRTVEDTTSPMTSESGARRDTGKNPTLLEAVNFVADVTHPLVCVVPVPNATLTFQPAAA